MLPFVVQLLQRVPLRRHLRGGAITLLLFEVTANIFHGGEETVRLNPYWGSVVCLQLTPDSLPCCGSTAARKG